MWISFYNLNVFFMANLIFSVTAIHAIYGTNSLKKEDC